MNEIEELKQEIFNLKIELDNLKQTLRTDISCEQEQRRLLWDTIHNYAETFNSLSESLGGKFIPPPNRYQKRLGGFTNEPTKIQKSKICNT